MRIPTALSVITTTMNELRYVGRFAPSPSGDLHFGSLVAALGSFLQARHRQGVWQLRIEDIDPPREVAGASERIIRTLEAYHLYWDGPIIYQSQRHAAYQAVIDTLLQQGDAYYCRCSRQQRQAMGDGYNGHCRHLGYDAKDAALRLYQHQPVYRFTDQLFGEVSVPTALAEEDFIIRRRDGLFAYNLAVVIDDIHQGMTEIVRGADLLEPTVRQIALYQRLNAPVPDFLHLPLVVNADGSKLSKQNHATAIDPVNPLPHLVRALQFLGQVVPTDWQQGSIDELLQWAITHWDLQRIPRRHSEIPPLHP